MPRLVDLQTAYITQHTTESKGKGEWIVYNADKEEIYTLPVDWTPKQAMAAIHLGRKFELIAFNKGVEFQKAKNPKTIKTLQAMLLNLQEDKKMIIAENEKLANELDKLTIKNT